MSRKVAILGLGSSGSWWSRLFHKAGWTVSAFDPDPNAPGGKPLKGDWKRHETISGAVQGASWVMLCLPERLDLLRMVIQRAQAEAPRDAVIVSTAKTFDTDEVQSCAIRPGAVIQIGTSEDGALALSLTSKNADDLREDVAAILPELAAVASLIDTDRDDDQSDDAISA